MKPSVDAPLKAVVIGTAGHIDHGKTSLVRRLTGVDTDLLPEERRRGISIDLGFASWNAAPFHFGVVDVPGHERFVRNMVAGAANIDVALLVIAADDGVMPQTREHLHILDLLGIRAGLIALTKSDLVAPEYQDLVEADIREVTCDTFLQNCRIVRVSSVTGEGIDQLGDAIREAAKQSHLPPRPSVFRMPIDRVFTKQGQGTVVTGTVLSGSVRRDDTVELLPTQTQLRVRSVQNHGKVKNHAEAHSRSGVNLASIRHTDLRRGNELATVGYLRPTQRMLVSIRALASSSILLQDRMSCRLHLGTTEVGCRLILKGAVVTKGESAFAELRVESPIVAEYGQRFILRRFSPASTIGGGTVFDPEISPRIRIKDLQTYGELRQSADPQARLDALLADGIRDDISNLEIECRIGVDPESVPALLDLLHRERIIRNAGTAESPIWVHSRQWEMLIEASRHTISRLMVEHQPRRQLPGLLVTETLRPLLKGRLLTFVLEELFSSGWLTKNVDQWGPTELRIQLSKRQELLRQQALQLIVDGGLAPPRLADLASALQQPVEKIEPLLQLDVDAGRTMLVARGLYYDIHALERVRRICRTFLAREQTMTVAQLRDACGITRQHSFPLCEWLDAEGITLRVGDVHRAGPNILRQLAHPNLG